MSFKKKCNFFCTLVVCRRHWGSCRFDKSAVVLCLCSTKNELYVVFKTPTVPLSLFRSAHYFTGQNYQHWKVVDGVSKFLFFFFLKEKKILSKG